jgi:hypothetical protein
MVAALFAWDSAVLSAQFLFIHGLLKVGKTGQTRYSAPPGGQMAVMGDPHRRLGIKTIGQATSQYQMKV